MKEAFVQKKLNAASQKTVLTVNAILAEYEAEGYDLSLRQLYYQMVARGYVENSQKSYKCLGDLVNNARLVGLVDWDMIKDRGRETISPPHWDSPAGIVKAAAESFALDKWEDQPHYIEVMVEKQALEGVLIPVCQTLDIRFTANKGYSSSSALYETGKRLKDYADAGKCVWLLYLGDHDPSGMDMTRDIDERTRLFSGVPVEVKRLALNMDQVRALNPPENPAKTTDTRSEGYIRRFGSSSWELDAIEPRMLASLVTAAVEGLRDPALWEAAVARENTMRAELLGYANDYARRASQQA